MGNLRSVRRCHYQFQNFVFSFLSSFSVLSMIKELYYYVYKYTIRFACVCTCLHAFLLAFPLIFTSHPFQWMSTSISFFMIVCTTSLTCGVACISRHRLRPCLFGFRLNDKRLKLVEAEKWAGVGRNREDQKAYLETFLGYLVRL